MRKAVLLIMIVAVAVCLADDRGYGGFILSLTMPDFEALSDSLEAHYYTGLYDDQGIISDQEMITYGGGAWGGEKNVLMGIWGFCGGKKFDGDSGSVNFRYSGVFFEPGYFINIWRGFGILPSVGLGATKIQLKMREILTDVDFDELLDDPARTSEAKYRTFTAAPALSINIPIEFIVIQIKGGYMWSPIAGKWKTEDGSELRETPNINPSGIFASAGLLFGEPD
jgi:hypothetical protein